ncbi:MAG: pimeloyl-ACP methyl ester carboxylesterase [Flavobacterium sp.]|jgi:pimeloyl-ACP methyl ester carboxylesterase
MNHSNRVLARPIAIMVMLMTLTAGVYADHHEEEIDVNDPNYNPDSTLFKGAANNPYFPLYFNALPEGGAETVPTQVRRVDLRPDREMTLYVEIYNPDAKIPLIVTPGGMGEINGFRGFARNVAAADSDLKVIIWDRRNMGRSEVSFGSEPLSIEEAEDLHVLLQRLEVGPATFYCMSSGSRSNMILAERYPEQVAALVIAPLTGGPIAAERLSKEYYLDYLKDDSLTSIEAVAKTPLWAAYLERNTPELQKAFFEQDVEEFLAAMKRTGEHLASYHAKTTLGMTDDQLAALNVPATLILHHGAERDFLHPIVNSRAATTLLQNSSFAIAPTLDPVLDELLPFVKKYTPTE